MYPLLIYEVKVAVALLVFYLFYRFLLRKETFHRFNRIVLVGTALFSFVLPLCIITIRKPVEMPAAADTPVIIQDGGIVSDFGEVVRISSSVPWWHIALLILFWGGVAFVLLRVVVSILSILRIVRRGTCVREEEGCKIIATERDIDPFSWMRYIVLSRKDWEEPNATILAHEKAHIRYGHSRELLFVDVMSAFQWFNPAIWMLRADLQEIHEYEADDAVLRGGADIKEYQYLLIKKAVGKSGYSVANSFNHSILKNRITMMSKSKSPLFRGLRVLYVLPLVCLGIGLQARTVYVPSDKDSEKIISAPDSAKISNAVNVHLSVNADDELSVELNSNGKGVIFNDLAALLRAVDDGFSDLVGEIGAKFEKPAEVRISADPDLPMHYLDEFKAKLREAGILKVSYVLPETADGNVVRHLPPATGENGLTVLDAPSVPMDYPKEMRKDICVVKLNSADHIFFKDGAYQEDADILRMGTDFLREHGAKTLFLFTHDKGASYGAYVHIQDLIQRCYEQVREEKAKELYGKSIMEISDSELEEIYKFYPMSIVERT